MYRVPLDLRDTELRQEYFSNHIKWFLNNHGSSIAIFNKKIAETYGNNSQQSLFDTADFN